MGDQAATSIGRCGVCSRLIYQMTPWRHVFLGKPLTAYPAHVECADSSGPEELPIVVTTPEELLKDVGKVEGLELPPMPSMPVKEQKSGRRTSGRRTTKGPTTDD